MPYKEHGTGRDTLIEYKSYEGEKIKVVSGPEVRRVTFTRGREETQGHKRLSSTRVYVNGEIIQRYGREEIPSSSIPAIRHRLEELARGGADSEELLAAIETMRDIQEDRTRMIVNQQVDEEE